MMRFGGELGGIRMGHRTNPSARRAQRGHLAGSKIFITNRDFDQPENIVYRGPGNRPLQNPLATQEIDDLLHGLINRRALGIDA